MLAGRKSTKQRMKTRWRSEADGWSSTGRKIDSPETLRLIRTVLEDEGPILVEHWYYRGSTAPARIVFNDYDEFAKYLGSTSAGDAIHIWSLARLCTSENELASGKCPDENGEVPLRGAY